MSPEVAVDDSEPAVGEEQEQEERAAEKVVRLRDLHPRVMAALPEML